MCPQREQEIVPNTEVIDEPVPVAWQPPSASFYGGLVLYHGELDVTAELLARDCAFLFRERVRTR